MKKNILVMLALFPSSYVCAADFVDTAKVVSSTPIYERVSEPRQECWNETVSTPGYTSGAAPAQDRTMGGAIVGGVVGGVVGHQVGKGSGNTAATIAGTIAGAIVGDRVANSGNAQAQPEQAPQTRQEQHCRQVENYREVIRGYNVTYHYRGQDITTRLPYQPGSTVRVGISVVEDNTAAAAGGDVRDRGDRREHRKERRHDD